MRRSLIRTLLHYRGSSVAVALCCAVAAAVLSGALVVGDSVRGSLRDLTLERLGGIDHAVRAPTFFTAELATRVFVELGGEGGVAPMILLDGSARSPRTNALASGVRVHGVDPRFFALFPGGEDGKGEAGRAGAAQPGQPAGVVVNQALAAELGVTGGDALLLAVERRGAAPRETLYGSTETRDVVRELRVAVTRVLPDRGLGRFSLETDQSLPLLAFVDLGALQRALGQEGRANALVVDLPDDGGPGRAAAGTRERPAAETVIAAVRHALTPEDLGLELAAGDGAVTLESRDLVFSPPLEAAVEGWATASGAPLLRVSTYLANRIEARGRAVPYSAIVALDPVAAARFGGLPLRGGGTAGALGDGEVLVDSWVADDLGVGAGDAVDVTYFEIGPREELITRTGPFQVRGVVALSGLGADPELTPDFPGISEAADISAWDPPFPVDLSTIRPRDEEFWDRYRAAPKVFFAPAAAALWSTRFGATTSMRVGAGEAADAVSGDLVARLRDELPRSVDPEALGFRFEAVRERGLVASRGATDFRWLFLGFSSFLIASAAILVALFFSLGVEQRASEVGLLLATGFPLRRVRRRFLAEGMTLAAAGVLAGALGAVLYAGLMIGALRTWWRAAVGTPFLYLHVEWPTLAVGALAALLVVAVSIALSLRRLGRLSVVALLRGATAAPSAQGDGRPSRPPRWWRHAGGPGGAHQVAGRGARRQG
jgi:ABC-type lipoprotein release transport system permease subunit